jgi:hypothetical protein
VHDNRDIENLKQLLVGVSDLKMQIIFTEQGDITYRQNFLKPGNISLSMHQR